MTLNGHLSSDCLGLISYDQTLLKLCRDTALQLGLQLQVLHTVVEMCAKRQSLDLSVLVIDMDTVSVSLSQLNDRLESLKHTPAVILVGSAMISPWNSAQVPNCVKRIVIREAGEQCFTAALHEILSSIPNAI